MHTPTTAPTELKRPSTEGPTGRPPMGRYTATGFALFGIGDRILRPDEVNYTPRSAEHLEGRANRYALAAIEEVHQALITPSYSRADMLDRLADILDDYRGGMLPPAE